MKHRIGHAIPVLLSGLAALMLVFPLGRGPGIGAAPAWAATPVQGAGLAYSLRFAENGGQSPEAVAGILVQDNKGGNIGMLSCAHCNGVINWDTGGVCNPAYPYNGGGAFYVDNPLIGSTKFTTDGCKGSPNAASTDPCVEAKFFEISDMYPFGGGCYYQPVNYTDASILQAVESLTLTPNDISKYHYIQPYGLPGPLGGTWSYGGNGDSVWFWSRTSRAANTGIEGYGYAGQLFYGGPDETTIGGCTFYPPDAATSNEGVSSYYTNGAATFTVPPGACDNFKIANTWEQGNAIALNMKYPVQAGDSGTAVFVADSHGCYWPIGIVMGTGGSANAWMVDITNAVYYLDYNEPSIVVSWNFSNPQVYDWQPYGATCPAGQSPAFAGDVTNAISQDPPLDLQYQQAEVEKGPKLHELLKVRDTDKKGHTILSVSTRVQFNNGIPVWYVGIASFECGGELPHLKWRRKFGTSSRAIRLMRWSSRRVKLAICIGQRASTQRLVISDKTKGRVSGARGRLLRRDWPLLRLRISC